MTDANGNTSQQNTAQLWRYLQFFSMVVVVLLVGTGIIIKVLNARISGEGTRIASAHRLLADVNEFAQLASDLEDGQRGYFLTEKPAYLEPYQLAVAKLPALSMRIDHQLVDDEKLRRQFLQVTQSLDNRLVLIDRTLELERTVGRDAGIALIRTDIGKAVTDDLRTDIAALRTQMSSSVFARMDTVTDLSRQRDGILLSLIFISALVSFGSYFLLQAQITAQRAMDKESARADKANLASREKSTFLANMSHEIRTPMNAIFGFAQLLKDTVKGEREKFYVQAITQSGQVLLSLINDILDMSKIEAGKLELHPEPTDLREVFRTCETLFSHMGAEKGLRLEMQLPKSLPRGAMVDALRLRQIIINLIGNALKYTEAGSVITHVSVEAETSSHITLVIAVTDTGVGIPNNKLKQIFEPFIQLNNMPSGSAPGAGLGLSIVKRIVEMNGGTISVVSALGLGSTFTVRLPHIPLSSRDDNRSFEPFSETAPPLRPLKIVVVDDVELNRRLIEGLFLNSPHQVLLADNGISGVTLATLEKPDVVFMDIRMPDIDGVEALRRIRANPSLNHVRVIAATASSMLGEEGKLRKLFDGYLRKPITRETIDSELRRLFPVNLASEPVAALVPDEAEMDPATLAHWHAELPELCEFVTRAARTLSSDDVRALVGHLQKLGAEPGFAKLYTCASDIANTAAVFDVLNLEIQIKKLQDFCDGLLHQ